MIHKTEDKSFFKRDIYISKTQIGAENYYYMIGISYWNEKDCEQLIKVIDKLYHSRGGKENF